MIFCIFVQWLLALCVLSGQENAVLCLFRIIIILVFAGEYLMFVDWEACSPEMRPKHSKQDRKVLLCYSHVDSYVSVEDHLYCWWVRFYTYKINVCIYVI